MLLPKHDSMADLPYMKPFTKKTPEDNYRNILDIKAEEEEDVRVPD
jgi:hypothetical protein